MHNNACNMLPGYAYELIMHTRVNTLRSVHAGGGSHPLVHGTPYRSNMHTRVPGYPPGMHTRPVLLEGSMK